MRKRKKVALMIGQIGVLEKLARREKIKKRKSDFLMNFPKVFTMFLYFFFILKINLFFNDFSIFVINSEILLKMKKW